jgi:methyltransferase (TIGR00027 family)
MEAAPSRTAMLAALARGLFRIEMPQPWVLDDAFALVLVGPAWRDLHAMMSALFPDEVFAETSAAICTRTRYAEDRLAAGSFPQYVILGAGLDSFAWRRPDLLRSLRVFEVDQPASQAWKLERVTELALPLTDSHVLVPADLEAEALHEPLRRAGFDWGRPALFSWIGVAPYLTAPAIESTLLTIAAAAAGSEVVFSYLAEDGVLDDIGEQFVRILAPLAASLGEPIQPGWPGRRDRAADLQVRARGRRSSGTCGPRTTVLRRPGRRAATLRRGDPGHCPGRRSGRPAHAGLESVKVSIDDVGD